MRFRPGNGSRRGALRFGWLCGEGSAKAPVVEDEWLVPLVHHLVYFSNDWGHQSKRLHGPSRHHREPDIPVPIPRQSSHQGAHRLRWRARQHPGFAVSVISGRAQRRQPRSHIRHVMIGVGCAGIDQHPAPAAGDRRLPELVPQVAERGARSVKNPRRVPPLRALRRGGALRTSVPLRERGFLLSGCTDSSAYLRSSDARLFVPACRRFRARPAARPRFPQPQSDFLYTSEPPPPTAAPNTADSCGDRP